MAFPESDISTFETPRSADNPVNSQIPFILTRNNQSPVLCTSLEAQYPSRRRISNIPEGHPAFSPPPRSLLKEVRNLKELMQRKVQIMQNIALEYSHLAGLMRDELNISGIEPDGYAEAMKVSTKAADDYECFQMYMDSLVLKISHETEFSPESENQVTNKGTCYILSPRTLRRLNYGSLQDIACTQEQELHCSIKVADQIREIDVRCRSRASSAPRDGCTSGTLRSSAISSTSTISHSPASVPIRPNLCQFSSLRGLSDSLPTLNTKAVLEADRGLTEMTESRGGLRQPPQTYPQSTLLAVDELIAWKKMEIATVQNILRVNMARSEDTMLSKKSRKAYRNCAQGNQKTLHRLYRESEHLKWARHSALVSRSQSVGRFYSLSSGPLTLPLLSMPPYPSLYSGADYQHLQHNRQLSSESEGVSDSSSLHTDERFSDKSCPGREQAQKSTQAIFYNPVDPGRQFEKTSSRRDVSSSDSSSQSYSKNLPSISLEVLSQEPSNGSHLPRAPINHVKYLCPGQTNLEMMRSYGRPNYLRHGSASLTQSIKWEFSEFTKFGSCHDEFVFPLRYPVKYMKSSTLQNHAWPSLAHFSSPHFNRFPQGEKLASELKQLTISPGGRISSSKGTLTTNSLPRFTLADKLSMYATSSQ